MTDRRRAVTPPPSPTRPPDSPLRDAVSRLLCIALCLGMAYLLGSMGRQILTTGRYDYNLDTGADLSSSVRDSNVRHEEVHATGDWAREQGRGFVAAAAT